MNPSGPTPLDPLDQIVEQRIREATEAGAFDDLPTQGKPLELDDLSDVPAELRSSYLLLERAGCLPDELALRKETLRLSDLLDACEDDEEARRLRSLRDTARLRYDLLRERRMGGAPLGGLGGLGPGSLDAPE